VTAHVFFISDDQTEQVLHTWTLKNGQAVCDNPSAQAEAEERGFVDPGKGLVFPADGERFIRLLPLVYPGPRVRARVLL
jgi:hypothetical protein